MACRRRPAGQASLLWKVHLRDGQVSKKQRFDFERRPMYHRETRLQNAEVLFYDYATCFPRLNIPYFLIVAGRTC